MLDLCAEIILVDIEGTTTSISFVKDVLFPYAKEHTKQFLDLTWAQPSTQDVVQSLINQPEYNAYLKEYNLEQSEPNSDNISKFVNYLTDKDLKLGPFKKLQGMIWAKGYAKGNIKGHFFDDVFVAFNTWTTAGIKLAVYSSGSVEAQKLIFAHSIHTDLTEYIHAYFDTAMGHKQSKQSYINIANQLGVPPHKILFLTDVLEEAKAAKQAGMQTIIMKRPGNNPLTDEHMDEFLTANNFQEFNVYPP